MSLGAAAVSEADAGQRTRPAAEGVLLPTAAAAPLPPGLTVETDLLATGGKG